MNYMNIQTAAAQWGLTVRRVQELCKNGSIEGATRFGRAWMIPANTQKPADGRTKQEKAVSSVKKQGFLLPPPRRTPLLTYTDLYALPGSADSVVASYADYTETERIFRAQFDAHRGNVDRIYEQSAYFISFHNGYYSTLSAGMLLAFCAMWKGDLPLWQQARQHIYQAPCKTDDERQKLEFWLTVTDIMAGDTREFPTWFKEGIFDCLPPEVHGTARLFYVKYLYIAAHELACGKASFADVEGLGLMRMLPYIIEPMISQAKLEHTVIAEAHLHLMAATVYHNLGQNDKAIPHIDRAIALCLPDRLYSVLCEYRTDLDTLLDERLQLTETEAYQKMKELHKAMRQGWTKLHNALLSRTVSLHLTSREREVAKLAAFGLGNAEIASRLHLELSSVKQYIFSAMNKVGAFRRTELGLYI